MWWNRLTAIIWGAVVVNHTYIAYRAGENISATSIVMITLASMVFVMNIYDWYRSIQRLKLLTRCIRELETLCDDFFKDSPRD